MFARYFLSIVLGVCANGLLYPQTLIGDDASIRIAFGSCAKQDEPQPVWDAIIREKPDVFLFIGDTVYADTTDASELRSEFQKLAQIEDFRRFRESCPIYAMWDDHDYGINDGGAEHPNKRQIQTVFLDFFGTPQSSPLRKQEGIYQSITLGENRRRVKIIMIDTRYHRGPLKYVSVVGRRLYYPNKDTSVTMLGKTQWQWLIEQLNDTTIDVFLVVSSIQIIPDNHPGEKWANLPHERKRLLDLLRQIQSQKVLILSGDQHLGELSRLNLSNRRHLYEVTSSGMTHTRDGIPAPNRHRTGKPVLKKNYGVVDIKWKSTVGVTVSIHGISGKTLLEHDIP